MSANATAGTVAGAVVVAVIALAPKIYDKVTGKSHDDADTVALISSGAGSVTSAALALLDTMAKDRDECRAELAAANARIDELGQRIDALRPPGH